MYNSTVREYSTDHAVELEREAEGSRVEICVNMQGIPSALTDGDGVQVVGCAAVLTSCGRKAFIPRGGDSLGDDCERAGASYFSFMSSYCTVREYGTCIPWPGLDAEFHCGFPACVV